MHNIPARPQSTAAEVPVYRASQVQAHGLPHCELGEGATWSVALAALLWTDITACRLWSFEPGTQRTSHWNLPWRLGSFALTREPHRLLAAFEHHLAWLDLRDGSCQPLVEFQVGQSVRANDGRCDRQGNFIFGTFDEVRGPRAQGRWWRYSAQGQLSALGLPPVRIPNGLAFSPDGGRMYFCDSSQARLRCGGYEATSARLANPQVFAPVHVGEPDGATVDALGHYWSAHWGAGAVVAYHADGQVLARVELPVSQPSCVAFGGPDLKTLYITTAHTGLSAAQLASEPEAGALFEVQLAWAGLPETLYGH